MQNLIEELRWRNLVYDYTEGLEEFLTKEKTAVYLGIDPTADSLHVGHLVSIILLKHFQLAGHKPILLIGGATGMIGDPSGKSEERKLLSEEIIEKNSFFIKEQLLNLLDFSENISNGAIIVNNYEWFKDFNILNFLRDVGKHFTINYLIDKETVKKRIEKGISFTEFSYQLLQAYDFYYLYNKYNCKIQVGGSDQWGNITSGIELIRRKTGNTDAYGLTCPLLTKSDGTKFGKTEQGNIWLNKKLTSPYKFYQFWINITDEEAEKYIKTFTFLDKDTITDLINKHKAKPDLRILQKELAKNITIMIHGEDEFKKCKLASEFLFEDLSIEEIQNISEELFNEMLNNVPTFKIKRELIINTLNIIDFLVSSKIIDSKSEARRLISGNGIKINKKNVLLDTKIDSTFLIKDKFILVQKGKKNFYIVIVE